MAGLIPPVPPFSLVRSVAGAESGPQRALSSPTAAAGLVTITPREEPQLPQPAPVTITATMSSEAETQQPPAAPPAAPALSAADTKPGTTGSGAGSGGPGGLTSAAPAGGDKKVIGEGRTRTGGWGRREAWRRNRYPEWGEPAGARPAGADSAARGRPSPRPPHPRPRGLGPPGPRARPARARAFSRAPCGPRAAARPSPWAAARRRPRVRRGPSPPRPPAGRVRSSSPAVVPFPTRSLPRVPGGRGAPPTQAGVGRAASLLTCSPPRPSARGPRAHPARARAPGLPPGLRRGGLLHVGRAEKGRQVAAAGSAGPRC